MRVAGSTEPKNTYSGNLYYDYGYVCPKRWGCWSDA